MLRKGFSLIELIITLLILGIIAGIGASLLSISFSAGFTGVSMVERGWQARLTLQRAANELISLRKFNYSLSNSSLVNFTNADGATVTYSFSGTNFQRNNVTVVANVSGVIFKYIDKSYNFILSNSSMVNTYCIYIYANVLSKNGNLPLQTVVCPRKLK